MKIQPFSVATLGAALREGWQSAAATRRPSLAYALAITAVGAVILGGLVGAGLTPFAMIAAGAFMLLGPALLPGFYGIAAAREAGGPVAATAVLAGFRHAAPALWALPMVCLLMFMIFVTDAAILYGYMVGGAPVRFFEMPAKPSDIARFLLWGGASGLVIAFLLYPVTLFSVPLLCERRSGLVGAVAASVRAVFANFAPAVLWALLLSTILIASCLLLPLLPLTLPWLAHAGWALYRRVLPND
ncbi:MAG: DUF2189 domain-containing protein [Betaproteobacteria bacterium]|nr:DUF2189 domain-containing protein [Betaproteobacteria bacterium]MCL2886127.1 DUF2189 domain-containing protein [Betaproteobacteria bacterium]